MSWADTEKNKLRRDNDSLREELNSALRVAVEFRKERDAARKVADAAKDWADACTAYDAGASGSGEYLRAREVLLRATVREYRALTQEVL